MSTHPCTIDRSAPTFVVTGRAGTGLVSPAPWRVRVPVGEGAHRVTLPSALAGRVLESGQELRWAVLPQGLPAGVADVDGLRDLEDLWAGTAVALDLMLDDGTRLSELGALDQYGAALDPEAQAGARRTWVDQWNLRRVALDIAAGRTVADVEVAVSGHACRDVVVYVDAVSIGETPAIPADPIDRVRTTRGSFSSHAFSRGNTLPFVGVPHGCLYVTPVTDAGTAQWMYSWQRGGRDGDPRPVLHAVATSHAPSPWIGERGAFQVMPSLTGDADRERRGLAFSHAEEVDRPHVWSAPLDGGIDVEVTAGASVMAVRCTFPPTAAQAWVVLDHLGEMRDVEIVHDDGHCVVTGLLVDHVPDRNAPPPPHHVHVRVPGPGEHTLGVDRHGRLSGAVRIDPRRPVTVLVGLSTLDAATAAAHVDAVGDFDRQAAAARRAWGPLLRTVTFEGASETMQTALASNLYRLFMFPTRQDEPSAGGTRWRSPYADDPAMPWRAPEIGPRPEVGEGWYSATNGFWDTYRTAWPLLSLLAPRDAGAAAQGFVRHFIDSGWVPRWSAPGPADCMTGTTSDTVLADMVAHGVPGLDVAEAWRSALTHASVPPIDERVGRKGLHPAIFRGYVSTAVEEGMSWTLDNALNDWSASRIGRALAAGLPLGAERDRVEAECEWLERRSLGYREVFDPERGFFVGRDDDGGWRVDASSFDPDEWGHDYTETNAWGTAVTVPHDGAGLADLHGGEAMLGSLLDRVLARPETGAARVRGSYGSVIHEMTEARDCRTGMLALSNQPAHHIPFMYMHAGRHDDAHALIGDALDRLFVGSDLGQGFPGDEDNGEMSAWWVLATLGLYPLVPGSATWVLSPPRVPRAVIQPDGGARLVIEVPDFRQGLRYIRSVAIDGQPWHQIWIPHDVLARGATLTFELSETPCGWAADSRPPSASHVHGFTEMLRDITAGGRSSHPTLIDDAGTAPVPLEAGDAVEVALEAGADVGTLMSLTLQRPGALGWTLSGRTDRGWVTLDERTDESFERVAQTRVFRLRDVGETVTALRLVVDRPVALLQLEVFAA